LKGRGKHSLFLCSFPPLFHPLIPSFFRVEKPGALKLARAPVVEITMKEFFTKHLPALLEGPGETLSFSMFFPSSFSSPNSYLFRVEKPLFFPSSFSSPNSLLFRVEKPGALTLARAPVVEITTKKEFFTKHPPELLEGPGETLSFSLFFPFIFFIT
jgi:hypothetical protein